MEPKIPQRLRKMPRYQGYVVPYTTWTDADGIPDFKVNDEARRQKVIGERRCSLCGEKLNTKIAFIGGPRSVNEGALYVDAGMHPACAEYAWNVCPFLVYGKGHSKHTKDHSSSGIVIMLGEVETSPPERMGMIITSSYTVVIRTSDNYPFVKAGPAESVVWREFQHG